MIRKNRDDKATHINRLRKVIIELENSVSLVRIKKLAMRIKSE
jgi:hypothetical protein